QKACASTTNPPGRGVFGLQNWNRDAAVSAPGKNNAFWTENNTGYRFIPSAGASRYLISEIIDGSGTVVATADTLTTVAGLLDIRYPNFCVPAGNNNYTVRTKFIACDNPAVILTSLDPISINRTNSLNATATATVASCGPPDGTITVTVPPGVGTPPYTYILDGGTPVVGPSPYTFTNVAAGTHTVVVTDASGGCTTTITPIQVTISGTISETHSSTPTACFSANNGTITITSAGGTGPYTFSIDGGAPQPGTIPFTFNNVTAGFHTILISDAGTGCNTGNVGVTVAVGAGVSGSYTATATACPGVNSGTITVTALTGTAPFTWSIDGGPFVAGASPFTFTNLSGGGHNVSILDNFNCGIIIPATVPTGPGVSGNSSTTPTSCPTVSNGTITVTALTGTAPFTWSLDGGPFVAGASPYTFTGVAAGPHNVTILDNLGCSIIVSAPVIAGTALNATTTSTGTACTGVNNGSITITAVTGGGPYTFSLDGGAPVAGPLPYTFNNVSGGSHTIEVFGAGGCSTGQIIVPVATGIGVTGNHTTAATSCPTATNGSITVTALTGTAPFTWVLDGGAPQAGASPFTFNNVPAGNHTILVTDNLGCTFTINPAVVAAGPPLTASAVAVATTCSGATNGSITVTPTSGTGPYTFSLDGGPPQSGPGPYTFNNVAAGLHNVVVTDAAGCQTTPPVPVTVNSGPVLTTTVNKTDVLCNGGNTGTITVTTPSTGLPPFQYSLDGVIWQAGNIFNGLAANTYTVYYRDNGGCQGSQLITVSQPAALTASSSSVAVTCNGNADGIITIIANGGVAPLQYSIDGGANWQSGNTFTVGAGIYNIIVKDANGCTVPDNEIVTQPNALTASSVNVDASCAGGPDGTITVTASGGNSGGYQYSIDGINFQTSNVFNVAPANYTVTVKDNLGCTTTFPAVVGIVNDLTFTPQTDPTICEGSSTQLNLVSNAATYAWLPATGLSDPTAPNPTANPTVTTPYTVTMTLGLCTATDNIIVTVNPAPIPDAGPPGFICYGQDYQLNGSGGVQYSWTPSTYLDNAAIRNPTSSAPRTITYTLSIVRDINGCPSLTTDDVTLDVTPPIKIYTFPADTILYPGDQVRFKAISAVPSANIFTWSPNLNMSNPAVFDPLVTGVNIGDSIIYKVTASSPAGCIGEAYVRLRVYKGPELYVPTAFTPNNDGRNDYFYPFPVGIRSINYFRVFNRWGQMVFSSTTLYKGWDGKFQGTDQASGMYVWLAQGVDKNNKTITRQGTVTLIR
ncbi:MAG TPA: gliding motility-associated C-terminal domain-containing protein, partial [Chitinophagaceae bacterium]|nr:gliding motility-associated C-terminal domain-containing protein [Chitinophagaceae bacterium]